MSKCNLIRPIGFLISLLFLTGNQTHAQHKNLALDPDASRVFFVGENNITQKTIPHLPADPSFSIGGDDIEVGADERRTLAPGSYGEVEVEQNGTLVLQSGKGRTASYFFEKLVLDDDATLEIDLFAFGGLAGQVVINIEDKLEFGEDSKVLARRSTNVTFNYADDDKIKIEDGASVVGNILAPAAEVRLAEDSRFQGQIFAKKIEVEDGASFGPHELTLLPKSAPAAQEESVTSAIPDEYELSVNYPNPFNPGTTINYALPQAGEIILAIYNMRGQLVRTLVQGPVPAGRHTVTWNGIDDFGAQVASGVYIYSLRAKDFVSHKRLTLLK